MIPVSSVGAIVRNETGLSDRMIATGCIRTILKTCQIGSFPCFKVPYDNRENDSLHNHVNTRAELIDYDIEVARLCEEVFGNRAWRYKKPLKRNLKDRLHLNDVDFDNLPTLRWKEEPLPEIGNRPD